MSLPKISMPLFEDKLPSNNKKVFYRPFTVKEEKILLIAQQAKDFKQSVLAIKQVLNNCITFEDSKLTIEKIAIFDLEYMLLKIRTKAVDDKLKLVIMDEETESHVPVEIDLEKMQLKTFENHTNKVKLNDQYTLFLKYPTIDALLDITNSDLTDGEKSFNIMVNCLDRLVSDDGVYDFSTETQESIIEFLEDLDPKNISGIKQFFDTTPRIRHEVKYKNKNGNEKTFVIEGTETFFM